MGKNGEDQCILTHSNKLSVITLAPSHPILKEGKVVTKVGFQVGPNTNRLENKVTGKGKRGAQTMTPSSPLCQITCSDGSSYTPCACMRCFLVEVNENLLEQPQLIMTKPQTDGYLAVVLSKLKDHESEMSRLKTKEQYQNILAKREAIPEGT